jgi:hypothetical protein
MQREDGKKVGSHKEPGILKLFLGLLFNETMQVIIDRSTTTSYFKALLVVAS